MAGIPLITAAALAFLVILGFALYEWFANDIYGVNNSHSLIYMGSLYGLAIAIYVGAWFVRRSQGTRLDMVYGEIPAAPWVSRAWPGCLRWRSGARCSAAHWRRSSPWVAAVRR